PICPACGESAAATHTTRNLAFWFAYCTAIISPVDWMKLTPSRRAPWELSSLARALVVKGLPSEPMPHTLTGRPSGLMRDVPCSGIARHHLGRVCRQTAYLNTL